jgi:hypothetical protein
MQRAGRERRVADDPSQERGCTASRRPTHRGISEWCSKARLQHRCLRLRQHHTQQWMRVSKKRERWGGGGAQGGRMMSRTSISSMRRSALRYSPPRRRCSATSSATLRPGGRAAWLPD